MFRSIFVITLIALSFNGICNAEFDRAKTLLDANKDQLEGWEVKEISHARSNDIANIGEGWIVSGKFWNTADKKEYDLVLDIQVYDKFDFTEGKKILKIRLNC
jgi:hypothetical protein